MVCLRTYLGRYGSGGYGNPRLVVERAAVLGEEWFNFLLGFNGMMPLFSLCFLFLFWDGLVSESTDGREGINIMGVSDCVSLFFIASTPGLFWSRRQSDRI